MTSTATVGTRVKWNGESFGFNSMQNGDLGTIVRMDRDSYIFVKMDNGRDQRVSHTTDASGAEVEYHWTGGLRPSNYVVVEPTFEVGARVAITNRNAYGASNAAGATGVIVEKNHDDEWYVKMDEGQGGNGLYSSHSGADWTMRESDLTLLGAAPVEPEVETLDTFKVKFLIGAVERGQHNGGEHPEQVKAALDRLAGLEFIDPSKDLLSFQKRVVALAMEAKAEHNWCGEPERYLTDIGLGHLLPVVKYVDVTVRVRVSAPAGTDDYSLRDLAESRMSALDLDYDKDEFINSSTVVR